jgi:hypothetical protein
VLVKLNDFFKLDVLGFTFGFMDIKNNYFHLNKYIFLGGCVCLVFCFAVLELVSDAKYCDDAVCLPWMLLYHCFSVDLLD